MGIPSMPFSTSGAATYRKRYGQIEHRFARNEAVFMVRGIKHETLASSTATTQLHDVTGRRQLQVRSVGLSPAGPKAPLRQVAGAFLVGCGRELDRIFRPFLPAFGAAGGNGGLQHQVEIVAALVRLNKAGGNPLVLLVEMNGSSTRRNPLGQRRNFVVHSVLLNSLIEEPWLAELRFLRFSNRLQIERLARRYFQMFFSTKPTSFRLSAANRQL